VREHALQVFQTDDILITLIDQRIQSMSWDDIATSKPLHDYLAKLVQQTPSLTGAFVADANGTVRNASDFFPALATVVATRDYFLAAQHSNKLVFGERLEESFVGKSIDPHFHIARRRGVADGGFDGVIVLSLSSSYFPTIWLQSWHSSAEVLTTLVSADLNVLARVPRSSLTRLSANGAVATIISRDLSGGGTLRATSLVDGIDRIASYRHVDPYDAYVVYGTDMRISIFSSMVASAGLPRLPSRRYRCWPRSACKGRPPWRRRRSSAGWLRSSFSNRKSCRPSARSPAVSHTISATSSWRSS
jgi:hypothetical protein